MDIISRQDAIDALYGITAHKNFIPLDSAIFNIKKLPSADASLMQDRCKIDASSDLISRQDAIDALYDWSEHSITDAEAWHLRQVIGDIKSMPSAQPEPLTNDEQSIFLAAMAREEQICKKVDDEWKDYGVAYEDSLVRTCHEITRKVKGALWT